MTQNANPPSLNVMPALDDDTLLDLWGTTLKADGMSPRTSSDWPLIVARASRATGEPASAMSTDAMRYWLAGFPNANTKAAYSKALLAYHRWMHREGHRPDDPTALMRQPPQPHGVPHPCSTLGLQRLLASPMPAPTRVMVLLAAYQGFRVHEIAKIHGEDVDLDEGALRVLGKGGKHAVLPLHPEVAAVAVAMPRRGWWFPGRLDRTGPIKAASVSCAISLAMSRAGVPSSAHGLRHWFGTNLVRSGTDLRTAQTLLRHASLATTAIYVEVADENRRAAVLRLPGPNG